MQDTQTRDIDDITFRVEQLDVKTARAVFIRLTHLLGPSLAELGKLAGDGSILDVDHTAALGVISKLLASATEEDLEYLVQVFMKKSKFKMPEATGLVPLVDIAFTGRLLTMFKWLAFAIEVNYADFFDVFRRIKIPTFLNGKAQSPSNSPAE